MAPSHRYYLLDVFTDEIFGGNQLAVFPDAQPIPEHVMPRIARELNLSETVFLLPPTRAGATARARIFTPARELPFAGHPTIGTACLLAMLDRVPVARGTAEVVLEQPVGLVPVTVRSAAQGRPLTAQLTAAQSLECREQDVSRVQLAAMLGLAPEDIVADAKLEPTAASTGSAFLFVPLRNRDAVARCQLHLGDWSRHLATAWAQHVFVYAFDAERPGSDLRARMFAPALGIPEDPATGSAATALAGLLALRLERDGTFRWRLEQGFEMGRPSILELEAEVKDGSVTATRVGGASVLVGEGTLHLP